MVPEVRREAQARGNDRFGPSPGWGDRISRGSLRSGVSALSEMPADSQTDFRSSDVALPPRSNDGPVQTPFCSGEANAKPQPWTFRRAQTPIARRGNGDD